MSFGDVPFGKCKSIDGSVIGLGNVCVCVLAIFTVDSHLAQFAQFNTPALIALGFTENFGMSMTSDLVTLHSPVLEHWLAHHSNCSDWFWTGWDFMVPGSVHCTVPFMLI